MALFSDKGEVGSSSLPRPTIHFNTNSLYKRALARFSKECLNSISHMLTKIFGGTLGELEKNNGFYFDSDIFRSSGRKLWN